MKSPCQELPIGLTKLTKIFSGSKSKKKNLLPFFFVRFCFVFSLVNFFLGTLFGTQEFVSRSKEKKNVLSLHISREMF